MSFEEKKHERTMQRYCECNSRLEPHAILKDGKWILEYRCSNKGNMCRPSDGRSTNEVISNNDTIKYYEREFKKVTGYNYDCMEPQTNENYNEPINENEGDNEYGVNQEEGMTSVQVRKLAVNTPEPDNLNDNLLPGVSALQFGYPDATYKQFYETENFPSITSEEAARRAQGITKAEVETRKTVQVSKDGKKINVSAIVVPRKDSDKNRIQMINEIMSGVVIDSEFINVEKEEEQNVLTLSIDQKKAICQNDIYDREFKYCKKCSDLCPMIIWQISSKQMKFANICTRCYTIYNLGVNEDKK